MFQPVIRLFAALLLLVSVPALAQEKEAPKPVEKPRVEKPLPPAPPPVAAPVVRPPVAAQPARPSLARPPVVRLELFRNRGFSGTALLLLEGNSNIEFSPRAVKVEGGAWLLCARPFFGGRCDKVEQTTDRLNLHRSFSGTVRSARPVEMPSPTRE